MSDLYRAIEAAKVLRQHITELLQSDDQQSDLSEDDLTFLRDTLEGETDLDSEIRSALLSIDNAGILVTGIGARLDELRARKERLETRVESIRGLIAQAMTVAHWDKREFDIATVSCRPARPRVVVDNEALIPSQFFKPRDPTLSKSDLNKVMFERLNALAATAKIADVDKLQAEVERIDRDLPAIDGCHIETGGSTLTIRHR